VHLDFLLDRDDLLPSVHRMAVRGAGAMKPEITPEQAIAFLRAASAYFERRLADTEGATFWLTSHFETMTARSADLIEHLVDENNSKKGLDNP